MASMFTFVHSTGPALDEESSKFVRSYVMKVFRRSQIIGEIYESMDKVSTMCIDQFGVRRALLALEDQQLMENMEWSFNQFFFASVLDPFGSLALDTLDNRVIRKLIHHYVHILAPAMFPLDIDGRSNPLKTTWFPFVVTDPALMQATLCIAAAHYQRFGGESLGSTQDLLRMQAIGLINQRLGDSVECISDGTIGAVLGLAESERMAGNTAMWEVHTQGLERMVGLRGGIRRLTSNAMLPKLISWADVSASSVALTYPRFDCGLIYKDPPIIPHPTAHFSPGFTRLRIHPGARRSLSRIVLSMQYISTVLEDVHSGNTSTLDPPTFTEAVYALQHRLLSLPFPFHTRPSGTPLVLLSCFGASIYLVSIQPNFMTYKAICETTRERMLKVLMQSSSELHENDDLILWVLFMGGMDANSVNGRPYFVLEIRRLVDKHSLLSWVGVREVLIRFFWLEIICAGPCSLLYDEAMRL